MTDQDIIARLSELTGVGRVYAVSRQKPYHKDAWLWTINRPAHLEHIIRLVLPWLGQRRALSAKDVLRKISSTPTPQTRSESTVIHQEVETCSAA
jgi:hypothetical protein